MRGADEAAGGEQDQARDEAREVGCEICGEATAEGVAD